MFKNVFDIDFLSLLSWNLAINAGHTLLFNWCKFQLNPINRS